MLLLPLILLLQVNALLAKDRRTNRHDLSIQRYAVTPLSHNVGIVGWVPHCDTLHALIRDYRESRRILLNIEHRLMTQVSSSGYMHACMHLLYTVALYSCDNSVVQCNLSYLLSR
jgi:phosphatidylinositol kinase/protein kinase (PI-3  family)